MTLTTDDETETEANYPDSSFSGTFLFFRFWPKKRHALLEGQLPLPLLDLAHLAYHRYTSDNWLLRNHHRLATTTTAKRLLDL